jgi:anthranilate phosphoribosyltransferase
MADPLTQFRPHFEKAASGESLTEDEAKEAFFCIMQGGVPDIQLAAFLAALKVRGETPDEIAGAVAAMRSLMVPAAAPQGAVDIVGTGGDAKGTFNISTAASFVVAGAGVPVAKHGNRASSSASGAADVLEKLGVAIDMPLNRVNACFDSAGLAFLWAPAHHPAMRHAAAVRQNLKLRTIFNLLGPLLNPAGVKRSLIGAYSRERLEPIAEVMRRSGAEHVWAVHGADGMDELSTTGASHVVELKGGKLTSFDVHPSEAGLAVSAPSGLLGGTAEHNAAAIRALLRGERGPFRDIVLFNAGAALIVAGRAASLADGAAMAAASIDEGRAERALDALIAASRGAAQAFQEPEPKAAAE